MPPISLIVADLYSIILFRSNHRANQTRRPRTLTRVIARDVHCACETLYCLHYCAILCVDNRTRNLSMKLGPEMGRLRRPAHEAPAAHPLHERHLRTHQPRRRRTTAAFLLIERADRGRSPTTSTHRGKSRPAVEPRHVDEGYRRYLKDQTARTSSGRWKM